MLKAFVGRGGTYTSCLSRSHAPCAQSLTHYSTLVPNVDAVLSLTQKGPNEARSEPDAALFGHSLRNMMVWYSHPKILTLKLTTLPPGYPDGFDFPRNTASYDRGW